MLSVDGSVEVCHKEGTGVIVFFASFLGQKSEGTRACELYDVMAAIIFEYLYIKSKNPIVHLALTLNEIKYIEQVECHYIIPSSNNSG